MHNNLLEVKNIKQYFPIKKGIFSRTKGYIKAVDNISFNIAMGKTMGIVGESGCGKSTTGRTILRLLEPYGGSVRFNDNVVFDVEKNIFMNKNELSKLRRDMQIIFQDPYASLDPRMNVGNIITEGIKKHKIAQGKEAIDMSKELLNLCGLDSSYINRYPHEFSGGQRQRIGIARALSLNPKFIVCDEPTAALDVSIQSQVLNLMLDLKEKFDLTYLFISHNLNIIRYFCDNISVMYLGKIVESAKSEELFNNPFHPYTKALLSSIPISDPTMKKERIILKGTVPSPASIPSGCRFHTRCPFTKDICKQEVPEYKEITTGHFTACHQC